MIPITWLSLTLCVFLCVCVLGLIQREDGSMEKELEELRRSRPKPPVGGDFTLSDSFFFTRRGIESIVDDEVHFFPLYHRRPDRFSHFGFFFKFIIHSFLNPGDPAVQLGGAGVLEPVDSH